MTKQLTAKALKNLTRSIDQDAKCKNCASLRCAGWETMPSSFNQEKLELVGTLKSGNEELWDEYEPNDKHRCEVEDTIDFQHNALT